MLTVILLILVVIVFLLILSLKVRILNNIFKTIWNVTVNFFKKNRRKLGAIGIILIIIYIVAIPLYVRFYLENYSFRFGDSGTSFEDEDSIISVPIGTDTENNDIIYNINITDKTLNAIGTRERYTQFRQVIFEMVELFTEHMPVEIKKSIATPKESDDQILEYTSQIDNCSRVSLWNLNEVSDIYDTENIINCDPLGSDRGGYCWWINLNRTCLYTIYPYNFAGRNPIPLLGLLATGAEDSLDGSAFIHELGHQVIAAIRARFEDSPLFHNGGSEFILRYSDSSDSSSNSDKPLDCKTILYALTYARFNSLNFKDIQDDICPDVELPTDVYGTVDIERQWEDYTCKWEEFWAELTCFWFNVLGGPNRGERDWDTYADLVFTHQSLSDIKTIDDLKDIKINSIFLDDTDTWAIDPENLTEEAKLWSILVKDPGESSYQPVDISIYDFMNYLYGPPAEEGGNDICDDIIEKYTPNLRYTCTGQYNESEISIIGIMSIILISYLCLLILVTIIYQIDKKWFSPKGPGAP